MSAEEHNFDRRYSDVNWLSLSQRMGALEGRVEVLEKNTRDNNRELKANTELTEQIHGQTAEMYEIFEPARNGFRMIGAIGNFGLKCIETGGKVAKPLVWIVALGAACLAWYKTGTWTWPEWIK